MTTVSAVNSVRSLGNGTRISPLVWHGPRDGQFDSLAPEDERVVQPIARWLENVPEGSSS